MDVEKILARLREKEALDELSELVLDELFEAPMRELVDPAVAAESLQEALVALLDSDTAEERGLALVEELASWLDSRKRSLGELLPREFHALVGELAERAYAPDREVILAILDRPAVRDMVRGLLVDALTAFGRKLRAPVESSRLARGLGELGRFARDRASGTLGSLATEVVGAVSSEVERQLERRAREFADSALSGLLSRTADLLSDPAFAEDQIELRKALIEGIFEMPAAQLAAEIDRADPAEVSEVLRRWLRKWAKGTRRRGEFEELFSALLERDGEMPLGELLGELGIEEATRAAALRSLRLRLQSLFGGAPFEEWLKRLLA